MKFSLFLSNLFEIFKLGLSNLILLSDMYGLEKSFSQLNLKFDPNKFPIISNFFTLFCKSKKYSNFFIFEIDIISSFLSLKNKLLLLK